MPDTQKIPLDALADDVLALLTGPHNTPGAAGTAFVSDGTDPGWQALSQTIAASLGTTENDYAIAGVSIFASVRTILAVTPTTSFKLTGIATTNWQAGKELVIQNVSDPLAAGARMILIERVSASSAAANRFSHAPFGMPLILMPGDEARFRFDGTNLVLTGGTRPASLLAWFDLVNDTNVNASGQGGGTGASIGELEATTDQAGNPVPVASIAAGTTTTGFACFGTHPASHRAGNGALLSLCRVKVNQLSTAAQEFRLLAGFHDLGAGTLVDMIGWKYDRLASTAWRTCCIANSVETVNTVTGLTAAAADFIYLGSFVNGDGSRAEFFYSVDGLTWTFFATAITTNIPATSARAFGHGVAIQKSAGTTSVVAYVNFIGARLQQLRGT